MVSNFKTNKSVFLTTSDYYKEPLRTVLAYLAEDEYEYNIMDITDQHINLNIKLRNKFFFYNRVTSENLNMHKCTKCDLILPMEMLWEEDRIIIELIEKQGWPCFDSVGAVHYYNPLSSLVCRGYIDENTKCLGTIPPKVFNLSSTFRKFNLEKFRSGGADFLIYEIYFSLLQKLSKINDEQLAAF